MGGSDPPSRDLELTEERDFLFLEELLEAEDSKSERQERFERLPPGKGKLSVNCLGFED